MATVEMLFRTCEGIGAQPVTVGQGEREVSRVHLIESDASIHDCERDSLVVLTAAGAETVRGFRFEALLARAAGQGVAMLAIPTTAVLVAPRHDPLLAHLCTVSLPADADLGALLVDVARVLAHEDSAALVRLQRGLAAIERAERENPANTEAVAARLTEVVSGLQLTESSEASGAGRLMIPSPDPVHAGRAWCAPDNGEPLRQVDAALIRAMTAVGAAARWNPAPEQALSTHLTELLVSRSTDLPDVTERCRALGLDPSGWHLVVAVRQLRTEDSNLEQIRRDDRLRLRAMNEARTIGASWHWTYVSTTLLLVCSWQRDPGRHGEERAIQTARSLHAALVDVEDADESIACGVGRVHQGIPGLRLSAAEARSSMRRVKRGTNALTVFDEFGLDLALLEWFSLESSRESAKQLLAPFRELPPEKAETLMLTLQAYLDNQGSLSATAAELYIHRNAVAYRMAAIRRLLQTDLTDPEERLALQLACRGRRLFDE